MQGGSLERVVRAVGLITQAGNGRRPVGIERMMRIYFLQQCSSLSDPAVEEALYRSPLMQFSARSSRYGLCHEHVCNSVICWKSNVSAGADSGTVTVHLESRASRSRPAPSSMRRSFTRQLTKNATQRDPEMHQTKKGKQWYFGMKAHVAWTQVEDHPLGGGGRLPTFQPRKLPKIRQLLALLHRCDFSYLCRSFPRFCISMTVYDEAVEFAPWRCRFLSSQPLDLFK